ncbi:hypothetical protein HMPREF0044_1423 [Gleimia coleocanis DSM 15436]|uniref:Uncharacterized protein n=1 Tax=Gleimia coleocanis DSM 15436 TaxID=525245 RepID=C0W1Y3_9ACTO|nr:hypothetical protein HMPREF0044_1423 [Gleimia coleocanis DSM 15436]
MRVATPAFSLRASCSSCVFPARELVFARLRKEGFAKYLCL